MTAHADMGALAREVYFPGRQVKFLATETVRRLVPAGVTTGIILKSIPMPDGPLKLLVEIDRDGVADAQHFGLDDVMALSVDAIQLRRTLIGRGVHFPWKSGLGRGLKIPKDVSEYGVITQVHYVPGKLEIVLHMTQEGTDAPFVTFADFSQCDLRLRGSAP